MQDQTDRLDAAFPMAAAVALDLIRRDEVRGQWLMPSALPKMSIGALACHLGRQVVRAAELLPMATDVPPLECADAHYHRAAWVLSTSPDDPSTDRSTDDADAALGAAVLADSSAGALEMVRRLLAAGTARDTDPQRAHPGDLCVLRSGDPGESPSRDSRRAATSARDDLGAVLLAVPRLAVEPLNRTQVAGAVGVLIWSLVLEPRL